MDGYRQTIRSNGSWLDRKETLRCFFCAELAPALVLIVQRIRMLYMEEHDAEHHYYFPEEKFWFLPSKENNKWEMPLQKVMKWWVKANKFQTIEDFTGVSSTTSREWLRKKSRPFVSTLKSIEERPLHLPYDEMNMKRSLTLLTMASNLVNNFFHVMCALVGRTEVERFISDFKTLYNAHEANEYLEFKKWVALEIEKGRKNGEREGCPNDELMAADFIALKEWEEQFYEEVIAPLFDKVTQRVNETGIIDGLEGKGYIGESILHKHRTQICIRDQHFTPSVMQLIKDAERLRMQIVKGGPSDWVQAQLQLPHFRERCMKAGKSFEFYPDYFDARLSTYSGMYSETMDAYYKAFHASRYRANCIMKNCAEEYLILGSYLYQNRKTLQVEVKKPLLNYLFKWICLMYPQSEYGEVEEKIREYERLKKDNPKLTKPDFVEFAASKFMAR